jgi:hypothetical protein
VEWAPNELGHNHYGGEGQLKESYLLDKRVMWRMIRVNARKL